MLYEDMMMTTPFITPINHNCQNRDLTHKIARFYNPRKGFRARSEIGSLGSPTPFEPKSYDFFQYRVIYIYIYIYIYRLLKVCV